VSKKSALHISKGVDSAPSINPRLRAKARKTQGAEELLVGILSGDLAALARGITLVESRAEKDRAPAKNLLQAALPHSGKALRIGISGVPGVGKSTFLENYGCRLLSTDSQTRIAVLAVDPSSSKNQGSILGDKTRMVELGKHPRAFIRPSASGGALGGVARATKEAMILCEAAGFSHIFVETVGVGQSETLVAQLVDCFLFLAMPGTGDELQGMKKGIMEMADVIAMNKSEGQRRSAAERSALEIRRALQLFTKENDAWITPVTLISGLEGEGFEELDQVLDRYERHHKIKGLFEKKRAEQRVFWFERALGEGVDQLLSSNLNWKSAKVEVREKVAQGKLSPFEASEMLLERLRENF